MGKYGQAALLAVELIRNQTTKDPKEAWEIAGCEIFGKGTSSQKKGCPKETFLGLCQKGLIKGIVAGNYTSSVKNISYALKALELINRENELIKNKSLLWKLVTDNKINQNGQLDVLISLYTENYVEIIEFNP